MSTPYGLAHQRCRNMRSHQPPKRIRLVKLRIQPQIKLLWPEHQRNTFRVDMAEPRVRRQCNDGEGIYLLVPEMPGLPEPRQCSGLILRVNVVDLLTLPFVKCADWNNATLGRIHLFP